MKLLSTLLITLFAGILSLQAQTFQDKFFHGLGYHFGAAVLPAFETNNTSKPFDQSGSYVFGLHYQMRYNLYEAGENMSVGLGLIPGLEYLGISTVNFTGIGNFNIPFEVSLNLGAGSTYNTAANKGVGFKAGIDFNINPVVMTAKTEGDDLVYKKFYSAPYVAFAFRYWRGSNNALREFFIRYDFMKNADGAVAGDINKPFFIRLGFAGFAGY